MIKTVIFDLDGLLADTERLHCRAYQEALQCHSIALSDADYADHWVRTGRGIAEWIIEHGLNLDPIVIRAYKSKCYLELLAGELRWMNGAQHLLDTLLGKKSLALASSSYRDAVDGVLKGLNVAHYFQVIVSGLDVKDVKPAPDIFLEAANRIGTAPQECLVLEDAEKGVIAAHRAGMRCIAVPNEHTRHHDFSKADKVCSSLTQVTLDLIDSF